MADVLFGKTDPGGKLTVTIPRSVGFVPYNYDEKPSAHRGYQFADNSPLFPFGYGLSYTTFDVGAPVLSAASYPLERQGDRQRQRAQHRQGRRR